jgi:phosphopantothenate synthetase
MPALVEAASKLGETKSLRKIAGDFNNRKNLRESIKIIKGGV